MKKLVSVLLWLVSIPALAQSPGVGLDALPAASALGGGELLFGYQAGTGGSGVTVCARGWCPVAITPNQLKTYINQSGGAGTVTSVGINSSGILSFSGGPVTTSGTFTPVWAGTSGGIPCFTSASALTGSAALTANALVLGGGSGACPGPISSLGTSTTVLHGNASGAPAFGAVNLATDVTGLCPPANGCDGVNNSTYTETRLGNVSIGGVFSTTQSGTVSQVYSGATTVTFPAGTYTLGYLGTPVNTQSGATYTFALTDSGKTVVNTDASASTYTVPANASAAFPVGSCFTVANGPSAGTMTLTITSDTMYWLPSLSTTNRTIAAGGAATLCKWYGATSWAIVSSVGVT